MNLQLFCNTDEDSRYAIHKPWVRDGWKYATDGAILVRILTGEPDTKEGRYPRTTQFLNRFPTCSTCLPRWRRETIECPKCLGRGKSFIMCQRCKGSGLTKTGKSCKKCGGSGVTAGLETCIFCTGTGKVPVPKGKKVHEDDQHFGVCLNHNRFNVWYLYLIKTNLTKVQYVVASNCLYFTGDGGVQGMLRRLARYGE